VEAAATAPGAMRCCLTLLRSEGRGSRAGREVRGRPTPRDDRVRDLPSTAEHSRSAMPSTKPRWRRGARALRRGARYRWGSTSRTYLACVHRPAWRIRPPSHRIFTTGAPLPRSLDLRSFVIFRRAHHGVQGIRHAQERRNVRARRNHSQESPYGLSLPSRARSTSGSPRLRHFAEITTSPLAAVRTTHDQNSSTKCWSLHTSQAALTLPSRM
jgi:hypothetical protein